MKNVLGLDMSLTGTGLVRLGKFHNTGKLADWHIMTHATYKSDPKHNLYDRCSYLVERVLESIDDETVIALEDYAITKFSATTSITLGAILRWNLRARNISYWTASPTVVKKFAAGNGKAEKDAMMMNVLHRWGFKSPNNNEADAYALAMAAVVLGKLGGAFTTKTDETVLSKCAYVDNSQ